MSIIPPPMLCLQERSGSFPFPSKYIPLPANTKIILGSQVQDANPMGSNRRATSTNGWFGPLEPQVGSGHIHGTPVSPISLRSAHAEAWSSNGQIFIRDLDSAFGTYVNGLRINGPIALNQGDTLTLGAVVARAANTPAYITDDHLKPIIAKVSLVGVPTQRGTNRRIY